MAHEASTEEGQSLLPPFPAYRGDEGYIFVSYCHQDKTIVYPELVRLHEAGYRIWYDEGIVPGEDWTANIETALLGCDLFIVWVSSNAVKSKFVRREMHLAVDRDKTCLSLYLEETQLPSGWNLLLSPIQAIHKYKLPDQLFWQKLQDGLPSPTRTEERIIPSGPSSSTQVQAPIIDTHARLALTTDPPGAVVYIAEQDTGLCTPCEYSMNLKSERRKAVYLELKLPGFEDFCAEVELRRSESLPIDVVLTDQRGRLQITSIPPGAEVSVDGSTLWQWTPCDFVHDIGGQQMCEVELTLTLASYAPHHARVTLRRGEVLPYNVALTYEPKSDECAEVELRRSESPPIDVVLTDQRGRLQITSTPPGAEVSIDGSSLWQWTPCDFLHDMGGQQTCEVEVALTLASFTPHRARVTLRRGEVLPYNVALTYEPESDEVRVNQIDGAKMVWVPPGEFLMGSKDGMGQDTEHPRHTVYLDGFWIYQTPVTVAQYRMFCQATKHDMPPEPSWKWWDDHPVVNVSWEDAAAYEQWSGAALPTEAQWEKAARGTVGRLYPWGNNWNAAKCCTSVGSNHPEKTAPVGRYPAGASPYGCLDMAGNVWEWCADWYAAGYYQQSPPRNPTGPANGDLRVLRGGSWGSDLPTYVRCAYRNYGTPTHLNYLYGFRCVVSPSEL